MIKTKTRNSKEHSKKHFFVLDNFCNEDELILIEKSLQTIPFQHYEGIGDFKLSLKPFLNNKLIDFFNKKIKDVIRNSFVAVDANYFELEVPFKVHSDGLGRGDDYYYKNFVLYLDDKDTGGLILFDQICYERASCTMYYKNPPNIIINSENKKKKVYNICKNPLKYMWNQFTYRSYISHIPKRDISGFTINSIIPHKYNRAIFFDSKYFHCSELNSFKKKRGIVLTLKVMYYK